MARIYDCSVDTDLMTGTRLARAALTRGELVVIPTDTVYGIAANAFDAKAVQGLLDAKGRTRQSPPPVLIGDLATLDALAETVPDAVRDLAAAFWPGGLTIVLHAQPSLVWDLGETEGTVALRMPNNSVTLELLAETGPLAVSSANKTGEPAALDAIAASDYFGDAVAVYLDGGAAGTGYTVEGGASESSTIVDATELGLDGGLLRILRQGVVSEARIREVVGDLLASDGATPAPAAAVPSDDVVDDVSENADGSGSAVADESAVNDTDAVLPADADVDAGAAQIVGAEATDGKIDVENTGSAAEATPPPRTGE